jgi:hypothetical protein
MTPNIPRVIVLGQARCGTSMMMRILQAGGLTVDTQPEPDNLGLEVYRNPYGIMESPQQVKDGNFINSIKCHNPDKISLIPSDYKFIYITRPYEEITASWLSVGERAAAQGRDVSKINWVGDCTHRYNQWQSASIPTDSLHLDYNWVCQNPVSASQEIAKLVNTNTFTFNVISASMMVDTSLYIKIGVS